MNVVEARGIGVRIGGAVLLDDVTLAVAAGECLAVVGPNGAGKTTLVDVLSGFRRPTAGVLLVGGQVVTGLAPEAISRRGLVRTFQEPALPGHWTVSALLGLARNTGNGVRGILVPVGDDGDHVVLEACGLAGLGDRRIDDLPLAVQKRVDLARAWVQGPRCLVADEPAAGLATAEAALVTAALASLIQAGVAVVLVEHRAAMVERLATRTLRLEQGRVQGMVDRAA